MEKKSSSCAHYISLYVCYISLTWALCPLYFVLCPLCVAQLSPNSSQEPIYFVACLMNLIPDADNLNNAPKIEGKCAPTSTDFCAFCSSCRCTYSESTPDGIHRNIANLSHSCRNLSFVFAVSSALGWRFGWGLSGSCLLVCPPGQNK